MGWAIGAEPLVEAIWRTHELISFCLPEPLQRATCQGIVEVEPEYYGALRAGHQTLRDELCRAVASAGLTCTVPSGGIYITFDAAPLARSWSVEGDDVDLCITTIERIGVAGVPVSIAYQSPSPQERWIRLCFSKDPETIQRAVRAFEKLT